MASVEIIGVYPVEGALEPVHLVEVVVRGSPPFDPGDFVQPDLNQPEENRQTAWDERALDSSGTSTLTESFELSERPDLLKGDARLVFFMYDLDLARPIRTPFGDVGLPEPSVWPDRLTSIEYEQP